MRTLTTLCITLALLALLPRLVLAQQSETFGPFELHYSVVNTTFLDPKIASTYGIVRSEKRAILNLAVREQLANGSEGRAMMLQGRTWDLIQNQDLEFREIREGESIYYIAEFSFINEEWRFFEITFRPTGANQTYTFKFKHQLYTN
ncbi:MAG TPA: DUF4426 domain-containing protein [Halioglobus sp.]